MYILGDKLNIDNLKALSYKAVIDGWHPQCILDELQDNFYSRFAEQFKNASHDFLLEHWRAISSSPQFGNSVAQVFSGSNGQLKETVTKVMAGLESSQASAKRKRLSDDDAASAVNGKVKLRSGQATSSVLNSRRRLVRRP